MLEQITVNEQRNLVSIQVNIILTFEHMLRVKLKETSLLHALPIYNSQ